MGSTYLARIASLYSGIAVKGTAVAVAAEASAERDRPSLLYQQERPGNSGRNECIRSARYVSQRHSTLREHGSSEREIQLSPLMLHDDWSEIASFKAELEALRLRMIDACLRGEGCAVEPPQAIAVDCVSNGNPMLQRLDRGSPTRAVQDEVASAVRRLTSVRNDGRRK